MSRQKSLLKINGSCLAVITALWLLAGSGMASDVPYVPTPQETVVEMLTMAGVGKGDVVYDLGSGDGRFVITAAEMGARGVGIEIDRQRVRESKANAEAAGVADRVRFIEQDLFEADFKDATVVTMFLLPEVNLRLRPKLLAELKPGTRVVSNSFSMGNWEPDQQRRNGRTIYLWIIPVNMAGTWVWSGGDGDRYAMEVDQDFQKISGSVSRQGQTIMKIIDGKVKGDRFTFTAEHQFDDDGETVVYRGRIDNDRISGSKETPEGGLSWKATRVQGQKIQ